MQKIEESRKKLVQKLEHVRRDQVFPYKLDPVSAPTLSYLCLRFQTRADCANLDNRSRRPRRNIFFC